MKREGGERTGVLSVVVRGSEGGDRAWDEPVRRPREGAELVLAGTPLRVLVQLPEDAELDCVAVGLKRVGPHVEIFRDEAVGLVFCPLNPQSLAPLFTPPTHHANVNREAL